MNLCTVSPERIRQIIAAYEAGNKIVALPNELRGARWVAHDKLEISEAEEDVTGMQKWTAIENDLKQQLDGQGEA